MKDMAKTQASGQTEGQEVKMKIMIEDAETKRKGEEEEAMNNHPLFGLFGGIRTS